MQALIDHARKFPAIAAELGIELGRLAAGQAPQALFITCSDSRVLPSLITGAAPGELFELRTAGNIIPPHHAHRSSSEAATIEYAVEVLGVSDVVICGHSHCGAVGALVRGDDLTSVPDAQAWFTNEKPHLTPSAPATGAGPDIAEAVQLHVLTQLQRLHGYPSIARRLSGELRLHGWYYEIHTGSVSAYRPATGRFLPL
ncbi:carbonic anhydrase [Sphaerisporangium siamense]|uniref:Carbonic anhydrase n=1 Tax=Sphaerisporangium siamense TaxID=795645 RepID=A0A7W7GEZ8_9ACTN|nr:carbonic anhydrase [Sphaerisporangium siamense]MBB4704561.1 carbonic anhydrase [Sphaerisporangium siamense]GII86174.1 carbonic anhydrase [Sphaerisporangium siamense]